MFYQTLFNQNHQNCTATGKPYYQKLSQQMTKKIKLSLENSLKSSAMVTGYYVNAFEAGGLSSQSISFVPL